MTPEQQYTCGNCYTSFALPSDLRCPTCKVREIVPIPNAPEQERAEARIDKAKLLEVSRAYQEYYRSQKHEAETEAEEYYAVGRMDSYTMLIHEIERSNFNINSLDREEQLMGYIDTVESDLKYFTEKVAEQDKEIQRLREALISERDEAMKWDGVGTVNRINKTLNQS